MEIEFGTIQEICAEPKDANGDPRTCTIIPNKSTGIVTRPLVIPWYWRARFGNLKVDDEVFYAIKGDGDGVIISRVDGDWDGVIRNFETVIQAKGDVVVESNVLVEGNTDVLGNLAVDSDSFLGQGVAVSGGGTKLGGKVEIPSGVTPMGAKPFNSYPGGIDIFSGFKNDSDFAQAPPLPGGKAGANAGGYKKVDE